MKAISSEVSYMALFEKNIDEDRLMDSEFAVSHIEDLAGQLREFIHATQERRRTAGKE